MAPRKRTASLVERLIVRLCDKERYTTEKIGGHLGMGKGAIKKNYERFKNPPVTKSRGRPRGTGERTDRKLIMELKEDPKRTAPEVLAAASAPEISISAVQRRLREKGLYGRVAAHKPYVSKMSTEKRRKFAKEHLQWTTEDWKKVLWTDESKLILCNSDGQKFRKPDDLFDAVSQEWAALPLQTLEIPVESMPHRCKAILEANGTPNKYYYDPLFLSIEKLLAQ
uniref:Transposase Tc1-like domain-containing protein n=1 Tax=Plectus sambesii TaxID=2011161 RepID=A0A914X412_9BILA